MLQNARHVWHIIRPQRGRYLAATIALIAASCLLYLSPLVVQAVLDGVLAPVADMNSLTALVVEVLGGTAFIRDHLWFAALVVVGLTALAGGLTYLRARWSADASELVTRALRDTVYDHLQRLPCTFFDRSETGDLVQRATSDVETIRVFLANHVVEIGRALVMIAVPIPFMLALSPTMTGAAMVLIPAIVGFSLVFFAKVAWSFKAVDEAEAEMTATIQENLTGIRVVRAFARQDFENAKFADKNAGHRRADHRLYVLMAWFWASSDLLCLLQTTAVLVAGVYLVAANELTVGALFFFLSAVALFIHPVRQMGRILTDLGKAMVALGRLREVLDTPREDEPAQQPERHDGVRGSVEFDDVSFAYPSGPNVLHNVSLKIEPHETVALVGASGAGKSTLVSLLIRLYDPQSGTVRLDGHPAAMLRRDRLRRDVAVVMQEPFLFSKTLGENLRLARPTATEHDIEQATRDAGVHGTIRSFEHGYQTTVGERGVTLSGGQRQRIALARALLRDCSVLVLDDALSAVDSQTESAILSALRQRRGRHTTILIAHRLTTLALADRVIVLEEGRVVQDGHPTELQAVPGPFARFRQNQLQPRDLLEESAQ